jgi:hypothetical protein
MKRFSLLIVLLLAVLVAPLAAQAQEPSEEAPTYVYFLLLKTTPEWLAFTPEERFEYLGTTITPLLEANPNVSVRFFDAEAFSSRYSDVAMIEAASTLDYQFFVEQLRETAFWGTYFEVVEIIPAIENAYSLYYGVDPLTGD